MVKRRATAGPEADSAREVPARPRGENRELRRVNEILKAAAVFFGAELDRNGKR